MLVVLAPFLAAAAGVGLTFVLPQTFTATTVIMPPPQQTPSGAALQSINAIANLAGNVSGRASLVDQYVSLVQSTTVTTTLVERFKLQEIYDVDRLSDAVNRLRKKTRVVAGKRDGLVTIEVDDESPQRAAEMANAYVVELRRLTSRLAVTDAQIRRAFFEQQLAENQKKFLEAQRLLQASGVGEGMIRAEPRAALDAYARLKAEASAAEVRLQSLRISMTETSPEVERAKSQLIAIQAQIQRIEKVNLSAADGEYANRYRDFKFREMMFELLLRQYETARLDESREGPPVQVVDEARPPDRRSSPVRRFFAVASFGAGLVLVLGVLVGQVLWRNFGSHRGKPRGLAA